MLSEKELRIYLAKLKIKFNDLFTVDLCIKFLFFFLNKNFLTKVLLPFLIPIKTKPTGFF